MEPAARRIVRDLRSKQMGKLIVSEFVSLDGVFEDPAWTIPYWSEEQEAYKLDEVLGADSLLLGRATYEEFATEWPSMEDETGFANRMNSMPKHVVSTTLDRPGWTNTRVIRGDIALQVASLKEQPGKDILVVGSGTLVRELMSRGLIDEYRIMVFPVVLGNGRRLFNGASEGVPLELADSRALGSGVVILTYHPTSTAQTAQPG
jgi:dihydrofolate reductase